MARRHLPCVTLAVTLLAATSHAWQTDVGSTPPASRVLAVDVDGAGNVLAAGRLNAAGGGDGLVATLAGLYGTELWQRSTPGSAAAVDQLRAVTHDSANSVIVAGQVTSLGTNGDAVIAKYEADGTLLWRL